MSDGHSKGEARKRVKQAGLLGPRRALTGEPLPPKAPNVAAAQARGQIGAEHVKIIEKFFADLPGYIDGQTPDLAEPYGVDPTPTPRFGPSAGERLPSPGEIPTARRRRSVASQMV